MSVCWRGAGGDMNKFAFQIISQLQCGGMCRRPERTPPNQLQAAAGVPWRNARGLGYSAERNGWKDT